MPSPLRVVGSGTDVHLTVDFHSARLERPQEKLVANVLLIPRSFLLSAELMLCSPKWALRNSSGLEVAGRIL